MVPPSTLHLSNYLWRYNVIFYLYYIKKKCLSISKSRYSRSRRHHYCHRTTQERWPPNTTDTWPDGKKCNCNNCKRKFLLPFRIVCYIWKSALAPAASSAMMCAGEKDAITASFIFGTAFHLTLSAANARASCAMSASMRVVSVVMSPRVSANALASSSTT